MIHIGTPYITNINGKSRLNSDFDVDGIINTIWFEVESNYEEYLCYERSDAFVIAVLNYAMRNKHDIICDAPMSEQLFYQIDTFLIDSVYKGSKSLYRTKLTTPIDNKMLACKNAVGTGISCGVDSLNVLKVNTGTQYKDLNVTHLAFNNVGSHGEGERAVNLFNQRRELAQQFCEEYGFEYVESNSNIMDVISQNHLLSNTYSSSFAIYCLQKLYKVYYYASCHSFVEFSLIDNECKDTSYYDLLLLSTFSTSSLQIYSEGANLSRFEKVQNIVNYIPSYTYLNVCTSTFENCGKCEKCIRTMVALDSLNHLENYAAVFNVQFYKENRNWYLKQLYRFYKFGKVEYVEPYNILKKEISLLIRLSGLVLCVKDQSKNWLIYKSPRSIYNFARSFYKMLK